MESATITQERASQPQQGRFPSVVTTDDLVFELGRQVVDKLNKEKLLEGLLKKKQEVESQIVDTEKIKSDAKKQVAVLENSNRQYEENNREISDELVRVRKELEDLKVEHQGSEKDYQAVYVDLETKYKKQIQELTTSLEEALKPKRKRISKKRGIAIE